MAQVAAKFKRRRAWEGRWPRAQETPKIGVKLNVGSGVPVKAVEACPQQVQPEPHFVLRAAVASFPAQHTRTRVAAERHAILPCVSGYRSAVAIEQFGFDCAIPHGGGIDIEPSA